MGETSFLAYYDSPWHDPCPAPNCEARWITHPDKSWEINHKPGCSYMKWLNAEDAKDKAND